MSVQPRIVGITKDEHDELIKTAVEARAEVVRLQSTIATQSIQLEAALAACREMVEANNEFVKGNPDGESMITDAFESIDKALALSPESTAGIIEERDRLRKACELDDLCERHRFGEIGNPEGSFEQRNALKDGCRERGWDGKELVGEFITRFRRAALAPAAGKETEECR